MQTTQLAPKRSIMFEDPRFPSDKRPWFGSLPELTSGSFSFAVVGDRCGMATDGVFEKALDLLKTLKPAFVLAVGDLIEGYWKDAAYAHEEWDELDGKVRATALPFFPTVGNHDYGNRLMAEVWSERKGMDYYAFRAGDALFLAINTEHTPDEMPDEVVGIIKRVTDTFKRNQDNPKEALQAFAGAFTPEQLAAMGQLKINIGDEQLAFFERVLADNRDVSWTFVNMHKPGWKAPGNEMFRKLEQLLQGRPHTIFAGHFHEMEYSRYENGEREHIQLGRTGGLAHGEAETGGNANLVLWVTMVEGRPTYRVIHLDGVREIAAYPPRNHTHREEH